MQGRLSSPPPASWTLLSRQILKSMVPLPSNTAHCICRLTDSCSHKQCPLQEQQAVGVFKLSLLFSCPHQPLSPAGLPTPIYRCLQECSPLVLTHLTGVLASHWNKASTNHPSCDPSTVTEVVIPLADFILKHRHLHLLQSLSLAPICLGNKF